MKTPITKERIRHHFLYSGWKYIVFGILVLFAVNLTMSMTQYRSPEELRVEFFVSSSGAEQASLQAYLDKAHTEVLPDMEQVSCVTMLSNDGSDPYTTMQLSTYIMVGEGDLYLLSKDDFKAYASQGAMMNLEPYIESGALNVGDIDLKKGTATYVEDENGAGETHVYGIPTDQMYGFWDFTINNEDMVLCAMVQNGNEDNTIKLMDYMIATLTRPKSVAAE